jgi:hypothetical protein
MGEIHAQKILVINPEGKRQLGRPRRIKEDNWSDIRGVGWEDVD